jgi:hypothetical protein
VENPGRAAYPASSISPPNSTQPMPSTTSRSQGSDLKVLGERSKTQSPPSAVAGNELAGRVKPENLTLKVAATEKAWLSVSAGGAPLYSGVLQPEESRDFSLQKPLKLVLGNTGGVKLSINDKPFVPLGKSGDVLVVQISAENFQQFLAKTP